jgi:hypothetical protein
LNTDNDEIGPRSRPYQTEAFEKFVQCFFFSLYKKMTFITFFYIGPAAGKIEFSERSPAPNFRPWPISCAVNKSIKGRSFQHSRTSHHANAGEFSTARADLQSYLALRNFS